MAENWIFFDMETMAQCDDAVILSIGVLYVKPEYKEYSFKELFDKGLYLKLNRMEQMPERIVEKSTIEWWKQQGDSAREVLSNNDCISVYDTYKKVYEYIVGNGFDVRTDVIWSRGLVDQRWWGSLCNKTFVKYGPVNDFLPFWRWRDTRTACDILTGNPNGLDIKEPDEFIKHNALCDSVMDAIRMNQALKMYE